MGENMRNGTRAKMVFTEIGPVEIGVPKDRDGSFEPAIVPKRRRRVDGVDQIVLSLNARGLTTGEIAVHFDEVCGMKVSEDMISQITEKVSGEFAEWPSRPLDPLYLVIFVDTTVVKIRDGQVRNTPFYVVMGVTVNGKRDIPGVWAGDGQEGARLWLQALTEVKNRGAEDALIAVCDGLKGSFGGDHTIWEQTIVQQCVVHLIRNNFRYAGRQHRDANVRFPQTCLHSPVKAGGERSIRRIRRRVGPEVPGGRASPAQRLGKVRAVPRVQRQDPARDLHH